MRKLAILVALLVLALAAVPAYATVPGPGGPYTSSFTIQNLTPTAANCSFSLFDASGADKLDSGAIVVPASKSFFQYVGSLTSLGSGQYSGVVSCDQQVATVANTGGLFSNASYNGLDSTEIGTILYAPGIYQSYHGFTSNVIVQNTTASPINVTLNVYASGSSTPVKTYTQNSVPANASAAFDQSTETDLPSGLYSAQILGTGAVAAVVFYWNGTTGTSGYRALSGGGTAVFAPTIMNNYHGFATSVNIYNLGSSPTSVTWTYSNGVTHTETIPGNSLDFKYSPNEVPAGLDSLEVMSNDGGTIVGLVTEGGANDRQSAYPAFASGGTSANAPIGEFSYHGFSSSATCQNLGTTAANITATYSNGSTETHTGVAPGGTSLFYQGSGTQTPPLPTGWNGSMIMSSANQIAGVVNQDQVGNTQNAGWLSTYDAIPQGATSGARVGARRK